MIQHLIHSSVLALLFYGVYHLFLRKETFFQWNRFFLLSIPVLSIVIPFLSAPFTIDIVPAVNDVIIPSLPMKTTEVIVLGENSSPVKAPTSVDYKMISFILYGTGVFIALISFLYKISMIEEIIRKGTTRFINGIWITKTSQKLTAFSFFKNVVIDEKLDADKIDDILTHEIIHVKQYHSWDLMTYEVYKIIFWFHPISYIAQKELKQVHEYIVDHVLTKNQESEIYQESLLKTVFGTEQFSLASSYFNKSILKNRILMLQKKKSTAKALFKIAFLLPIVLASLIFTACTEDVEEITITEDNSEILNNNRLEFLPRLSNFKYGKKDYFKDVSAEDIAFSKSFTEKMLAVPRKKGVSKEMFADFDFIRYSRISKQINENSSTLVVDDTDNKFHIIKITESPYDEPTFTGGPKAWNTHATDKIVESFLDRVGKNNVSDLTNEEYSKLCSIILKAVTTSSEYVEEVIKIEEIHKTGSKSTIMDIPFAMIEEVPHYSDCTGTQLEIKKCTIDKITSFVNENFNTNVAKDLPGRHKITVQFKIDKSGNVVDVQSKAKLPKLQNEAARVVNLFPQMVPGKQNGEAVTTIYALPIIFEIKE